MRLSIAQPVVTENFRAGKEANPAPLATLCLLSFTAPLFKYGNQVPERLLGELQVHGLGILGLPGLHPLGIRLPGPISKNSRRNKVIRQVNL